MLRDKINKELIKKTNEYIDNVYKDFQSLFIGEDAYIPLKQTVAMIHAQKKESCVLAIRRIDKLGFRGGEFIKKFFRNLELKVKLNLFQFSLVIKGNLKAHTT